MEKLNHLRVKFVEKIDPLMFVSRQKKKTVLDITLAVYNLSQESIFRRNWNNSRNFSQNRENLHLQKNMSRSTGSSSEVV